MLLLKIFSIIFSWLSIVFFSVTAAFIEVQVTRPSNDGADFVNETQKSDEEVKGSLNPSWNELNFSIKNVEKTTLKNISVQISVKDRKVFGSVK